MVLFPTPGGAGDHRRVAAQRDRGQAAEAAPVDQLQQRGTPLHGVVGRRRDHAAARRGRRSALDLLDLVDAHAQSSPARPALRAVGSSVSPSASNRSASRSSPPGSARRPPLARRSASSSSWSSSSGSSGSTASLISNRSSPTAPISRPGLHDAGHRVAGPLLVAGLVGGVRRAGSSRRGRRCPRGRRRPARRRSRARHGAGRAGGPARASPRATTRRRTAGSGTGCPSPRSACRFHATSRARSTARSRKRSLSRERRTPLVLDQHPPVARVGAGADEPLLEQGHQGVALGVLQPALVALEERDGASSGASRRRRGLGIVHGRRADARVDVGVHAHARVSAVWSGSVAGRGRAAACGARRRSRRVPSGRTAANVSTASSASQSRSAARCSRPKISTGRRSDGSSRRRARRANRPAAGTASASSRRRRRDTSCGPPSAISSASETGRRRRPGRRG